MNEKYLARYENQFNKTYFPTIRRHSENISKNQYPEIASVLFASNPSQIQLHKSYPMIVSHFEQYSDFNHTNSILHNMPSKKRITRVRFTEYSRTAIPRSSPPNSSRVANQSLYSPSATCTANPAIDRFSKYPTACIY